jgi:hypothetical protein
VGGGGSRKSEVRSQKSEAGPDRGATNFVDISSCCTTGVSISWRALHRHRRRCGLPDLLLDAAQMVESEAVRTPALFV